MRSAGSLSEPRALLNSVVLPTGDVLVTGGQHRSLPFSDADSVLTASLWSPDTRSFRDLAAEAVPRNYHSWSLLLADGRVISGGGGLCGECAVNHPDVEIFTPPYLLRPDGGMRVRPRILGRLPGRLEPGRRLTVRTSKRVESWALVRTGSVTHSINSDQRRIEVGARRRAADEYRLRLPGSRGPWCPAATCSSQWMPGGPRRPDDGCASRDSTWPSRCECVRLGTGDA